jgi:hypothetical protein
MTSTDDESLFWATIGDAMTPTLSKDHFGISVLKDCYWDFYTDKTEVGDKTSPTEKGENRWTERNPLIADKRMTMASAGHIYISPYGYFDTYVPITSIK